MANEIVPISHQLGNISPRMRESMALDAASNRTMASNVVSSYPLLSIRGKEFTFRLPNGQSQRHEQNGFAMPYIDLVLVEGSSLLSKTYYQHGFDPSEFTRPDCWSLDSVKPDPSSPALQAGLTGPICATCPMNVFGSKITDAGKKIKACQDYRRIVVLLPHQIGLETPKPMAMRVPQSSLRNLKMYVEMLEGYSVGFKAVISRLSFSNEAFPQLQFTYVNILEEPQFDWVKQLAQTPLVQGMVYTPDFENAASTPEQQSPGANQGLKPLEPSPVPEGFQKLMGEMIEGEQAEPEQQVQEPVQQAQEPVQQAADLKAVPSSNLIELPDGKWFDTVTKQYVDAPTPKVEMPALDPETMTLPDGKFYNSRLKAYVTGPEIGAPGVGAEPEKKARASRAKKPAEAPAEVQTPPQDEVGALAAAAKAQPSQPQQAKPKQEPKQEAKANTNGGIKPATMALDDVLRQALGENPKT